MHKSYSLIFFLILFFSSCTSLKYYQLYEAKAEGNTVDENHIIFEDDNCKVSYNLWSKGGDMGFTLYNKTDTYITLDLSKSFFVVNGAAYDYYLNRTYSTSSSSAVSASAAKATPYTWSTGIIAAYGSVGTQASSSITEKSTRTLPPKTQVTISQFSVTDFIYSDCDFVHYPYRTDSSSVSFEKSQTPYEFYNLLHYSIDDTTSFEIKNTFYIEKISNYPERLFILFRKKNKCGETFSVPQPYFKYAQPNSFYLKYE